MAAALKRLFHGGQGERARLEPEPPPPPPPPPWGGEIRRCPQHGGEGKRSVRGNSSNCGGGGGGGVSEEQPSFPRYGCQYWNLSPRTSYRSPYPVGPELQGQGIEPSYTNGIYGTPYSATGTGSPYPNLPPTNPYFSSGNPHAPYATESSDIYRAPPPAPSWNYPPPDCPAEGSMVRQQGPGYPPPQAPGFPVPPYPYGDCNHNVPPQRPPLPPPPPPQPRLQDTTWRTPGVYGIQAPYSWSPSPTGHGNQYFTESSQSWSPSGSCVPPPPPPPPLLPPSNNSKDSYNHLDQGTSQHRYFSEANQMSSGTMNDFKPASFDTKPSVSTSKVQYSAQPQLYDNIHKKPSVTDCGPASNTDLQPQPETLDVQPGIQKVMQVMEGVQQLEEEVDEFVGKKTDKEYCLLEEMLTKKLLELDSIETGGQDNVRQARKEAVNRIQATLEELERKGL